eukprot:392805-Prymnesium_polylepis.1
MSMTNFDTVDPQERDDKIKIMDSMCAMHNGNTTYLGLTYRQWIYRFLDVDPTTSVEDLRKGGFHIVELGKACECGSDADDLQTINSEDEEEHEYNGKMYNGKELLDL